MSVIAKGVDFPEACIDCPFAYPTITDIWRCSCLSENLSENSRIKNLESKLNDCPIVEIPNNHGRLIDADELLQWYDNMRKDEVEKLRESKKPSIRQEAMHKIEILDKLYFQIYDRQKTVIEAEGEK